MPCQTEVVRPVLLQPSGPCGRPDRARQSRKLNRRPTMVAMYAGISSPETTKNATSSSEAQKMHTSSSASNSTARLNGLRLAPRREQPRVSAERDPLVLVLTYPALHRRKCQRTLHARQCRSRADVGLRRATTHPSRHPSQQSLDVRDDGAESVRVSPQPVLLGLPTAAATATQARERRMKQ